jgi:beta-glucosidase
MTFPADMSQLPNPELPGSTVPPDQAFDVSYPEGSDIGYRWYASKGFKPLFPFGYGLSYTHFAFGPLTITKGKTPTAIFTVTNSGTREGVAVPQLYLIDTPGGKHQRLLGWQRLALKAGETRTVSIAMEMRLLADWQEKDHGWRVAGGKFSFALGESSGSLQPSVTATLTGRRLPP